MEAAGKRYIQHPSRTDVFTLWGIGDLHFGAPGCDLKRAKRDIEAIKADPFSFWIGLGDMADYVAPGDKRFCAEHLDIGARIRIGDLGQYYMEEVRDLYWPIRDKCLGLLYGNHEEKYFKHNNRESGHGWLCTEMAVPNLKYCAFFDLAFYRKQCKGPSLIDSPPKNQNNCTSVDFRFYVHHGSGSSSSPGGKLNMLIKHMQNFDADIFMMGHVHDQKAQRMVFIGADRSCTSLMERQKVGVICGSYLKTYHQGTVSYGEVKGYQPTSLGAARVQIMPSKREIRAEV